MKTKISLCLVLMLLGCLQLFAQQKVYVSAGQRIYSVNPANCSSQLIGPSGAWLYDIALTSDGQLWGIANPGYFYKIDTLTGAATFIGVMGFQGNALAELNDTTLLMAGSETLYKVNVKTGSATFIGATGYTSTGDLTWYDNDLYLIATLAGGAGYSQVVKIQLNSTNTGITSSLPVNNSSKIVPCLGVVTVPFTNEINSLIGFYRDDAYKICPFDASYQLLCSSIVLIDALDEIGGAASIRLPAQHPMPSSCASITATKELSSPQSFEIIPNPASDNIQISNMKSEIYKVGVYNIAGKKLFQSQISNMKSQTDIDVSGLDVGVYFLQIQTYDLIEVKKLVIAR